MDSIERTIITLVQGLKLGVEALGAAIVAVGICVAFAQLIRMVASRRPAEFTAVRLTVARHLALALEFELGADIPGTAISPTWDQIGKLGAVAAIRTGLNFFLAIEMQQEQAAGAAVPAVEAAERKGDEGRVY